MVQITLTGNIVKDPELRYSQQGTAYMTLRVAGNTGKNKEGIINPPVFIDVKLWQKMAENCAISLTKGMRIVVTGEMMNEPYEYQGKTINNNFVIRAHEIAPSLRYATAAIEANPKENQGEDFSTT